jgi:hypothetical protein
MLLLERTTGECGSGTGFSEFFSFPIHIISPVLLYLSYLHVAVIRTKRQSLGALVNAILFQKSGGYRQQCSFTLCKLVSVRCEV